MEVLVEMYIEAMFLNMTNQTWLWDRNGEENSKYKNQSVPFS